MAKVQIGAVIGVEGAREYRAQLEACTAATKNLASQTKLIEASFEGATKSVNDLAKQKIALKGQIAGVGEKLAVQRAELTKVVEAYKRGDENALKYKNQMINLATETNKTEAELYRLEQRLRELGEENGLTLALEAWKTATSKTGEALREIGTEMSKYVTLPIAAAGVTSIKTAADYQSAFTGVRKTVDEIKNGNGDVIYSYEELRSELAKIPLETASTYESVMGVAEAAGQLNVEADKIPTFTKNIIMLADSTNVSANEGATSIAQFLNIMGEAPETVEQFGSSLVALGNNTATDEASILALATRLASAGKFAELSTSQILGLSAAMSSVGLTAEAGGTAMSTTLNLITKAVASGGEDLQKFADISNMTVDEFAEKWRTDAVGALQDLLVGMANLDGGKEELLLWMDEVGWAGIRQSDTMRRLTLDYDGVSRAVEIATSNYQTNAEAIDGSNALTDEATKRYADFNSQMSQLKESVKLLGASFGEILLPWLSKTVDKISNWIVKFTEMDDTAKKIIMWIAGIVAAIGPALVIIGNVLIFAAKLKAVFAVFGATLVPVIGTIAAVVAGLIALGAAIVAIVSHWDSVKAFLANLFVILLQAFNTIKELIVNQFNIIVQFITDIVTGIVTFLRVIFENGVLYIKQVFENIKNVIVLVLDFLKGLISAALELLKGNVSEAFTIVKDTISTAMERAWQIVKSSLDTIGSMFTNLVSSAWNWGKDLIANLANGIKSQISVVTNAAKSIADRIASFLHFSEPDVGALSNFHTWMPDMMKGLAKGIDDNLYLVDNAISRVADTLGFGGTTMNYGGVVINLNVPQGANGRQLVDEIERELANRTLRRKAVYE